MFAVVPLTCAVPLILTDAPVVVKLATSAVTFVAYGTVTATVFALSSIAVLVDVGKVKAVIALAGLAATLTVTT